ncbi:hypothetical protein L915_11276, partial [Phytophthora nicotianae]
MLEWIQRVWKFSITGCRLLLLDSLKTHKMASVRNVLQEECCSQVEFVTPGITGVSQPMDVAVMKVFKDRVSSPTYKRASISRIVAEAWNSIPQE